MQKIEKSNILLPLLEESYRSEYTEWARRNLRFSDAGCAADDGDKCERAIYYDIYQADQKSPLTSGSLVLFDDGRLHEQDIRRRLRTVLQSPEKELTDEETGARGKIDNTIRVPSSTDIAGLEIKTVNEYQYQEMAKNGHILQSYYDQIQAYLMTSKLPYFICLIKNRNSMGNEKGKMPFLEFRVDPDTDRQAQIRAGMKTTKEALEKRILPPRPFLRESTQCQYCRYKHVCWTLEVEQEKIERFKEGEIPQPKVLETALKTYAEINAQMAELKKFQDEAKAVVLQYFKATGNSEVSAGTVKATYTPRSTSVIDIEYLKSHLTQDQLIRISDPNEKKIEELIEAREIDASVLDEAIKKQQSGYMVRVTDLKPKEQARQAVLKLGGNDGREQGTDGTDNTADKPDGKPGKGGRDTKQRKKTLRKSAKKKW